MGKTRIRAAEVKVPADIGYDDTPPLLKWWYAGTKARAYMCRRRTEEVMQPLAGMTKGCAVLDVGCSWGLGAFTAYGSGFRAVGLDLIADDLTAAVKIARANGARVAFVQGSAAALPFRDASFDALIAVETIEHIYRGDRATAFSEMARVLKPGGLLSLSTPNYRSVPEVVKRAALKTPKPNPLFLGTHMPANPVARASYHPHTYHDPYKYRELIAALIAAGFSVAETRRFLFMYKYCPDALFRCARVVEWLWERTPVLRLTCMTQTVVAKRRDPSQPPPA